MTTIASSRMGDYKTGIGVKGRRTQVYAERLEKTVAHKIGSQEIVYLVIKRNGAVTQGNFITGEAIADAIADLPFSAAEVRSVQRYSIESGDVEFIRFPEDHETRPLKTKVSVYFRGGLYPLKKFGLETIWGPSDGDRAVTEEQLEAIEKLLKAFAKAAKAKMT